MKKKLFILSSVVLTGVYVSAQIVDVSVYDDCSKNGYNKVIDSKTGTAPVLSSSGRTSCEWVQLWENGPKWATFNVGATITNYANISIGADATPFYKDVAPYYTYDNPDAPYYNTANVGGAYPWNNSNINGRETIWTDTISTEISDIATSIWGSNWKTPTMEQLDSLHNDTYTTWIWCDGNATQYVAGCTLKGYKVSGVGDYAKYSIFLPAAGYYICDYRVIYRASGYGNYWSSTKKNSYLAYSLDFRLGTHDINGGNLEHGRSVRAVLAK